MNFIESLNVELLWDILVESEGEFIMKDNGYYENALKSNFLVILKNFYEHEKKSSTSLMDMNKKIITVLMNDWIPMLKKQEQDIQKERNQKEEPILFTVEEIQNDRKSQFEKEMTIKENEFKNAMTQSVPKVIEFNEKKDEPIGEMEKLIAETIAQRNFEMNQIQNVNKAEAEKWLKSEKIKYIKIGEQVDVTSVELPSSKKQLSWAPQLEETNDTDSIFKKLKPISKESSEFTQMNKKMDLLLDKMNTLIDILSKKDD